MLLILMLTINNIVSFLIGQRRWRVAPLMWLYILATLDVLMRIYTLLFVLDIRTSVQLYLPSVFKLLIGYT